MDHSDHGGGMGGLLPIPTDPYFAKIYWMFVGGAIAAGTLIHVGELLLYRQRSDCPCPPLVLPFPGGACRN